jgi:RecA/RadA recombinase
MAAKKKNMSAAEALLDAVASNAKTKVAKDIAARTMKLSEQSSKWKFIDFRDPKTNLPALGLEHMFGTRGLLCGRAYKIEAGEGVGKSSFCYLSYAAAQLMHDATCVHLESELATQQEAYIEEFGADTAKVLQSQPGSLKNALFALVEFGNRAKELEGRENHPTLISLDSVSGFSSDEDLTGEASTADSVGGLGYHARKMSAFFRDYGYWLNEKDVVLLMTAQLREKINTGFGYSANNDTETTIAGKPIDYHSTAILQMSSGTLWEDSEDVKGRKQDMGNKITLKLRKNKLAGRGRIVPPVIMRHGQGFDFTLQTYDLLRMYSEQLRFDDAGKELLHMDMRGSWLTCEKYGHKSQGEDGKRELTEKILRDEEMVMRIRERLRIYGFGFDFETRAHERMVRAEAEAEANGLEG